MSAQSRVVFERTVVYLLGWLLLLPGQVLAIPLGTPLEFESPEQRAQYATLVRELRCTVCQSETLHESKAPLAADMRRRIYDMTLEGKGEKEIVDFLVQRYGDYVRYRPPLQANTLLLWSGPFLVLIAGALIWWRVVRRRQHLLQDQALPQVERADLNRFRRGE